MAFEHKPGSLSIFKNDYKKSDNQPDYKGKGKDLDGNDVEIALWVREGKSGKFFSAALSLPREKATQKPGKTYDLPDDDLDDEIPF